MDPSEILQQISVKTPSKIVLAVADGLGGLPDRTHGKTELEAAHTPNLGGVARRSICGTIQHVGPGITPGSGPGHLSLFGYDPLKWEIGRGVLGAVGIGFQVGPHDVCARMNFCTLGPDNRIVDRRAGRIPTETTAGLCGILRQISLPGVEVFVEPERDYRAVLVLRGQELSDRLTDSDPQREGELPLQVEPLGPEARRTADLVNAFIASSQELLRHEHPANGVLVRGFSKRPDLPSFHDLYKLNAAAVAIYPMYRGLASLAGMTVLPTRETMADEVKALRESWRRFDYFFVHFKATDSAGEDGDFARKVSVIEQIDALVADILALKPEVFAFTGDHSTPSQLRAHSWHPVPFLLYSKWCLPDGIDKFSERTCRAGSLGLFPASHAMGLMMAHALKLNKFGA